MPYPQPQLPAFTDPAPPARRITKAEMVLLALYQASAGTTNKVPYEELVLHAWRGFPEAFSLRNYPQYPDASDIHKALYGGALKANGLIVTLGDKVFRLTEKGVEQAARLAAARGSKRPGPASPTPRLARGHRNYIDHALRSRAFQTWTAGSPDRLVDYDARVFFQFSTGTGVAERRRKVEFAREAIASASRAGLPQAQDLSQLADYLAHTFGALFGE